MGLMEDWCLCKENPIGYGVTHPCVRRKKRFRSLVPFRNLAFVAPSSFWIDFEYQFNLGIRIVIVAPVG